MIEEFETAGMAAARQERELNAFAADVQVRRLVLDIVGRGIPDVDIAESLTTGEVSRTMEGASQVTMTVHDLGRDILQSGILEDERKKLRAVDVQLDGLWFRLVKLSKQGDDLELTFEDREVAWLRAKKGPRKAASRAKVTRAEYIFQLVRSVKTRRIPIEIPELHKKQPIKRASKKEREKIRDRRRSKGFDDGTVLHGKEGPLGTTQLNNASKAIAVADDLDAPDLATLALILAAIVEAPDFKNPKDGTGSSVGMLQLTDAHYGGSVSKRRDIERISEDFLKAGFTTASKADGGAIGLARKHPHWTAGKIAQICQGSAHPTRYDKYRGEAREILEAWGGTAGKAAIFKRYEFKVDKKETYWDAIQRLAAEVNWRAFVTAGRFFYMSEEDLYAQRARFTFTERTPGVSNIDFDYDYRKKVAKATVSCRIDRWKAPPGTVAAVRELGPASGRWLVESVTRGLFSAEATIILKQPMAERKEPRPEVLNQGAGATGASAGSDGVLSTEGGAKAIVDQCVTLAQATGGSTIFVASAYRPGSTTTSGNPSDHSHNNSSQAARDIAKRGVNAITGPPSKELDKAVVAIGNAFDRDYKGGKRIVDTFHWRGYRIQIIWRTPEYGGHMGHIHVGVKKDDETSGAKLGARP